MNKILPDNKCWILYNDLDRTCKEIEKFSKKDAKAYRDLSNWFLQYRDLIIGYFFSNATPPSVTSSIMEQTEDGRELLRLQMTSIQNIMDDCFESEEFKSALYIMNEQSGLMHDLLGLGLFFPLLSVEMHRLKQWGTQRVVQ